MTTDDSSPDHEEGSGRGDIPVPEELLASGLLLPSETEDQVDTPEPVRSDDYVSSSLRELSNTSLFSQNVHDYLREFIRLADQKATFFFAGGTTLLAFLYRDGSASSWVKVPQQWNLTDLTAFLAVTSLMLSVLLAVIVVIPRTSGSRRGTIFWNAIVEHQSARMYADSVLALTGLDLTSARAEHCFELAMVCKRKYATLRWSLIAGGIGLACTLVMFVTP